jgi:phosphinothricin acetyltransferase
MIRKYRIGDEIEICKIYNYYVKNTHHTFETELKTTNEMAQKIRAINSSYPFLVYEENGKILAYAYASQWKERQAYKQTIESSIYLKQGEEGKGIGTGLYTELIAKLKEMNLHCVLGGISLPNNASIALHEKLGFKKSGVLKEVGFKLGKWIDVGYWTLHI